MPPREMILPLLPDATGLLAALSGLCPISESGAANPHTNPHRLQKKVQRSDRSEASFSGSLNFRRGDAGSVQWRFTTAGAGEAETEAEKDFVCWGRGEVGGSFDLPATGRKLNSICSAILLRNKRDERNFRPLSFPFILPFFSNQKMIPHYQPPNLPLKYKLKEHQCSSILKIS